MPKTASLVTSARNCLPVVLQRRDFRRLLAAHILSCTGSAMVPIVIVFTLYERGAGSAAVAEVLAAEAIPMALLLLIGGAIADRIPRRRVMVLANLLCMTSQGVLAALLFNQHAPLPVMMALMACLGIGTAFYAPGRQGLIPQIVEAEQLQSANAILATAQSAGNVAGPVFAGLLMAGAGGAAAIAIDSLSYGISAALLITLQPRAIAAAGSASLLTRLREGWSAMIARTWLWSLVLYFGLIHLLVLAPILVLGPLRFAHSAGGALEWGWLMSLFGTGSILGGLTAMRIASRRPVRIVLSGVLVFATMPASLAANLPTTIIGACFFAGGIAVAIAFVLWDTMLQTLIPEDLLSRVSAYDNFGSVCLLPLGYLVSGPMADILGREGVLWSAAGFAIVSTAMVLMLRDIRTLTSPGITPQPANSSTPSIPQAP